jgi:hypothetical protein
MKSSRLQQAVFLSCLLLKASSPSSPLLIVQTVIPKCGTTAMRLSLRRYWEHLLIDDDDASVQMGAQALLGTFSGSNTSSPPRNGTSSSQPMPFLAGDCGSPHMDKMKRCITNKFFPCLRGRTSTARSRPQQNETKRNGRCRYHFPEHHISYSELMTGFLPERGIRLNADDPRVVYFTIFREPVARVVSEFYQWKRGWCCMWFFSPGLSALRESMNLSAFVQHPECPAHNRMTWMLADLPSQYSSQRNGESNSGGGGGGGGAVLRPSDFSKYFSARYGGEERSTEQDESTDGGGGGGVASVINHDRRLLESALRYIRRPNVVVGLTESLAETLALFLISFPAGRDAFFTRDSRGARGAPCWSLRQDLKKWAAHNSTAAAAFEDGDGDTTSAAINGGGGEGGGERGRTRRITATAAVTIRHDRNATYEPPSDAETAAIRRRNALDIELYEAALQIHAAQLKRSELCE